MPKSRLWLPWAVLIGLTATVEALIRFAVPFSQRRVLVVEAILLLGVALAALRLMLRPPRLSGWRRTLQWFLVWAFALGAIRAAIWAAGQPVKRANLTILLLATVVLVGTRVWRRRGAGRPPQASGLPRSPS